MLATERYLEAIRAHTLGLAEAAQERLDARIEHCPDWSMADLVVHLTEVHRFWEYVARVRPSEPPELPSPPRPSDDELVPAMLTAMEQMIATLEGADEDAECWTWGLDEHVRFITRHQVQEAAVHHFDAAHTVGARWAMEPELAVDAVEEFLTESVGNRRWPVEHAEPLGGALWFCACREDGDTPQWHIIDGELPGTLTFTVDREPEGTTPLVGGHTSAAEVLLWLYQRVGDTVVFDDEPDPRQREAVRRFRAFTNTD